MKVARACQPLRSTLITRASALLRVDLPLTEYWSNHFTADKFLHQLNGLWFSPLLRDKLPQFRIQAQSRFMPPLHRLFAYP